VCNAAQKWHPAADAERQEILALESPGPQRHGHRQALGVGRASVIGYVGGRSCRPRLKTALSSLFAGIASAYLLPAMKINPLPAGFVVPAQPVKAPKPPVGTDWVHEIKHDGYRIIVRRDGPAVRLYSRNANDRARMDRNRKALARPFGVSRPGC
jgi:hypothetical protein